MDPHQPANALGIDVAHYDGQVNWNDVLNVGGRSFGFAKATEGAHTLDALFADNWLGMGQVGITRGAYHLFRSNVDAAAQADHFLNTVARKSTDMPPTIDIETVDNVDNAARIEGVKTWLDAIETELGQKPIIYTFPAFWSDSMDNTAEFKEYPLWIARFTTATTPGVLPGGWSDWTFWQHAAGDAGAPHVYVPGVQGVVDADRFNGTHEDLVALFNLRGDPGV